MEKKKSKKILLIGAGTIATGILGYLGWGYVSEWMRNRKAEREDEPEVLPASSSVKSLPVMKPISDGFPLRHGSRGANVKLVQQALIDRYGKSILPKFGADGGFGNEMTSALKKLNLPAVVDESTFNVLVKTNSVSNNERAKRLYDGIVSKNINQTLSALKNLKSVSDYAAASQALLKYRFNGVTKTLVNALLDRFTDTKDKDAIRMELLRMGLKYDGKKWSTN